MVRSHMIERAGHTTDKIGIAGHSGGLDAALHPLRKTIAQQSEMVPVQLRRIGFLQLFRMNCRDDRFAVVLIEAWPGQRWQYDSGAGTDGGMGLDLALQGSGQRGIEPDALACKIFAKAMALLLAKRAELVIVIRAERGLTMADEVEGAHVGIMLSTIMKQWLN